MIEEKTVRTAVDDTVMSKPGVDSFPIILPRPFSYIGLRTYYSYSVSCGTAEEVCGY